MADIITEALEFANTVETGDGHTTTWDQRSLEAQLHIIRLLACIAQNTQKPVKVAEDLPVDRIRYHFGTD